MSSPIDPILANAGIAHWNLQRRWVLCRSLAQLTVAPAARLVMDGNVEMTWRVFADNQGEEHKHYCDFAAP